MVFKNPYFLLLIPLAPCLGLVLKTLFSGRQAGLRMPLEMEACRETLKVQVYGLLSFWGRILAITLAIIALARPQEISVTEIPPVEGVDIMLCIDTSMSMAALDFNPYNRLDAAKNAATDFVKKRLHDRIGITVFGGNTALACPLTLDYQAVLEFLDSIYLNMTESQGTAVGDALATSINHIKNSAAKSKVIILLTDGRSNTGLITDPVIAARTAAAFDIKIYAIGTASKGRAQIPTNDPLQPYLYVDEDLDEGTLMAIAKTAGGEFFRAKNYAELQRIYSKIDELEKTKFEAKIHADYEDKYLLFLLPSAFLFLLIFILERTVFMRIP
ncbi:MAG: VWA domain-containing protein [Elusimicrobia bacterium]|nr:VWA domain-containing protein [Elusimicrobiota bacterium]